MTVQYWFKIPHEFKRHTIAQLEVICIISETKRSIRFLTMDGHKISIKRNDIISIEK